MAEAVTEVVEDMVVEDTAEAEEGAREPIPAAVGAEIPDMLLSRARPDLVL
jgi:hypothetical protein